MLTLDRLLIKLVDNGTIDSLSQLPANDKKVLVSLRQQLKRMFFFTEKQGNLLSILMKKYRDIFPNLEEKEIEIIETPSWSENFRKIEEVKKIYFEDNKKTLVSVEFTRDNDFKKKLTSLFPDTGPNCFSSIASNKVIINFNEYNIIKIVEFLKNYDFDIDAEILEITDRILDEISNKQNYLNVLDNRNKKLFDLAIADSDKDKQELFLLDRRIRFQYTFSPTNTNNDTLSYKIANRKFSDVWINENTVDFDKIIESLVELKRFPILLIFNPNDPVSCNTLLEKMNNALENNNIEKSVGIYFRFDSNSDQGFNQKIKELKFNTFLDSDTNVVGVSAKQIPKFLLSSNWYPKTVITNVSNFRNSKVFMYCKSVDLVICLSDTNPLTGDYDAIV